jgi:ribonuclease Z
MDCGEGTYGQLLRQFGPDAANDVIKRLDAVWISHKHADHHGGLLRLLEVHRQVTTTEGLNRMPPLLVIAPKAVLDFVASASAAMATSWPISRTSWCLPLCRTATNREANRHGNPYRQWLVTKPNGLLSYLESVPVHHCHDAFGLIVQVRGSKGAIHKMVYSGDTRPCAELIRAGYGADLLIHEATFDDTRGEDAVAKRHSTVSEAIEVGMRMNARRTVLTHFSQRYPKMPPEIMNAGQRCGGGSETTRGSVAAAFDSCVMHLSDTPESVSDLLPSLAAVLESSSQTDH